MRADGRANKEIRPLNLHPGYQAFAEGSALMEMGMTRVVCAASVEERVPPFLRGAGMGWVTAEYAMLPRSTLTRSQRETTVRGRSAEIQRMIGRSLRAITDRAALGERTIHIDCDVLQADGGTRTAAVNGAYVALHLACRTLIKGGVINQPPPLIATVAAVSVGLIEGELLLDLTYAEDQLAQVDFTVVMTSQGDIVEVHGATEGVPFSQDLLPRVVALAQEGLEPVFKMQREAVAGGGV